MRLALEQELRIGREAERRAIEPIVGFVHDEIISEVPEEKAEEMLRLQEEIMISSMRKVVPNIEITVESNVTKEYCK